MFKDVMYFKVIGANNFGSYPYRIGLNTLKHNGERFDSSATCTAGGLYFCTIEHIFAFYGYGDTLCEISVPKGATVVAVGNDKYKADKIIIESMKSFDQATILSLLDNGADIHAGDDYVLRYVARK